MSEVHSHQNRFLTFALLMAIGFATLPAQAVTTAITGGDLTEGLDFAGSFRYAVDVNGPGGTIQNLIFTPHGSQAGLTMTSNSGSPDAAINGGAAFGGSANDLNLNNVMKDLLFRFTPNNLQANFAVTPGKTYQVQLMLSSLNFGSRTQDILVNGVTVADNLSLPAGPSAGVLVSHTFTAAGPLANVTLGPSGMVNGNPVGGDNNAILNAFAVKEIFDKPNRAVTGSIIAGSSSFNGSPFNVPGGSGDFTALNVIDNSSSDVFASTYWLGSQGVNNEFFVLDLGGHFDIEEIQLKNTHNAIFNDSGTQNFRIFGAQEVDGLNNLINPYLIVQGVLSDTAGQNIILADIFNAGNGLNEQSARFLRFEALDFRAGDVRVGLNEILVFGDVTIPEPATAALGLLGLAGLMMRRRRMA